MSHTKRRLEEISEDGQIDMNNDNIHVLKVTEWPSVNRIKINRITSIVDFLILKKEFLQLAFDFVENAKGLGLAANQAGDENSWFIMRHSEYGLILVINPLFIGGIERKQYIEGCFSIPGQHFKVRRYKNIQVDFHWTTVPSLWKDTPLSSLKFYSGGLSGQDAQIFQHEFAHLCGKCIKDVGEEV